MASSLSPLMPLALMLSAIVAGYIAVLIATHAGPFWPGEDRFAIEICAAILMMAALCAAFAGGRTW